MAVEELLAWTRRADTKREGFPFLDGDVGGYAAQALRKAGAGHDEAAFDALLERIPLVSGLEALPVVGGTAAGLPGRAATAGTPFALSTPHAGSSGPWPTRRPPGGGADGKFGNFSLLVGGYGLPEDADAMRRYAEG